MVTFSEAESEALSEVGDWLFKNNLLNLIDKRRWPLYRGHSKMMARLLKKYQLTLRDEKLEPILQKAPEAVTVQVRYMRNGYGQTAVFSTDRLPSEKFHKYKDLVKQFGLWFDGETKSWFVPAKNMQMTNFEVLFEKICDLNFEVEETFSEDWLGD
jgi:hypothetical protein